MTVYRLSEELCFPSPEEAEDNGLLAVGGDLSAERLLLAYSTGIFPWPHDGYPLLWFSPPERMVLRCDELRVGKRLARSLRGAGFRISLDEAFPAVIESCARAPRPGQDGTWITPEIVDAYCALHRLGFAHSAEAWDGDRLAGGLYGICIGGIFVGESMFARTSNASKAALIALVAQLRRWEIDHFDAQVFTPHIERLGARLWPRGRYLELLRECLARPTRRGAWVIDDDLSSAAPA